MLRSKPKLRYSGLTVILSNPSRFDKVSLLSATGGHLFNDICLRPEMNVMQCDVRLVDDPSPLLPDTKCILVLGESGMHKMLPLTRNNSIGEVRGSVYQYCGICAIPSFFPQDAVDFKNLEAQLNPLSADYSPDASDGDEDDADDYESTKKHGKTKRGNYAFWLKSDCNKAKAIINNGGKVPAAEFPSPIYHIFPQSHEVINLLSNTVGKVMWFDIETDFEAQNLQCFAFSFDGVNIYSVPILDFRYNLAYNDFHFIMRALAIAFEHNTVVAHNGACFDFFVMSHKYRIPCNKVYDTMIAMHRCYPDIEKSLGHCVSLWTWEHFHKDEDSKGYMSHDQMMSRMKYCAKDVYTLFLVYQGIEKHAKRIPGLKHSIDTAMAAIRPYLITSLQGIKFSVEKVREAAYENDRLMEQYNRMIKLLIGEKGIKDVQSAIKGKAKMFAGSNTQCCVYFHDLLGYPVVARSVKTQKPSLGKKAMFKLALKHSDNPVIQLVLAYRKIAKEYGTYKFIPWKDDDGRAGQHSVLDSDDASFAGQESLQLARPVSEVSQHA